MTPRFDNLIQNYYTHVSPGSRVCRQTGEKFEITPEAFAVYKSLNIPLPTVAPWVRLQRLRAHMGGLELFQRNTINGEPVISMYDPESPVKILKASEWYGDTFDGLAYGIDYTAEESFFDQWKRFSPTVPRPHIMSDTTSENCSWCLYELSFKNSYANFGGVGCENVMFSDLCVYSKYSVDIANCFQTEWSYESVQCVTSARVYFSEYCTSCADTYFSFGCEDCSDVFGCINLKNKKYCFFNQQLTKEEYKKRVATIDLSDAHVVDAVRNKVTQFWQHAYYHAEDNFHCEHVQGESLADSSQTHGTYSINCERVYNAFDASYLTDCCDMATCTETEQSINGVCMVKGSQNSMAILCEGSSNVEYSELCISCEHCFGCIGLTRKKFCIFNKKYTEEEYFKRVDELKAAMMNRGEYGEFFPLSTSLMAYNTSHADVFFPMNKEDAHAQQTRWYEFPKADTSSARPVDELPTKLSETTDDILQQQYICPETGRPFRIVKPELEFHKKVNIALPRMHPSVRRKKRYEHSLNLSITEHACTTCKKNIYTAVPLAVSKKVLCDDCYNELLTNENI